MLAYPKPRTDRSLTWSSIIRTQAEATRVGGMAVIRRPSRSLTPTEEIALARPEPPAEDVRKTITILIADIVDSSRLSLTLDPEALRELFARYFDEMTSTIQRHGGVVDRYVGDEILPYLACQRFTRMTPYGPCPRLSTCATHWLGSTMSLRRVGAFSWLIGLGSTPGRFYRHRQMGTSISHWRSCACCQASPGGRGGQRDLDGRSNPQAGSPCRCCRVQQPARGQTWRNVPRHHRVNGHRQNHRFSAPLRHAIRRTQAPACDDQHFIR